MSLLRVFCISAFLLPRPALADETIIACMGQYESSCEQGYDIFVEAAGGRGVDDEVIAKQYCTARSVKDNSLSGRYKNFRIGTKGGGCCGYAMIKVTCLDN